MAQSNHPSITFSVILVLTAGFFSIAGAAVGSHVTSVRQGELFEAELQASFERQQLTEQAALQRQLRAERVDAYTECLDAALAHWRAFQRTAATWPTDHDQLYTAEQAAYQRFITAQTAVQLVGSTTAAAAADAYDARAEELREALSADALAALGPDPSLEERRIAFGVYDLGALYNEMHDILRRELRAIHAEPSSDPRGDLEPGLEPDDELEEELEGELDEEVDEELAGTPPREG